MASSAPDEERVDISPESPSVNQLEEIEPEASGGNQALVISDDQPCSSTRYEGDSELHITNSDGIRDLARLMRSVSVKSDQQEPLPKHVRSKSSPPVDLQDLQKNVEAQSLDNIHRLDSRLSDTNSQSTDTPTASLTSEISDVAQFYPEEPQPSEEAEVDFSMTEEWRQKPRHFFVLTEAGKPVYTRHGSEDKLAPLMGVLLALVSFVHDQKDTLRFLIAGQHKFVFMPRPPLILVGICSTHESVDQVKVQLNYIYNTIISILTLSQLTKIYETKKNFDLRRLLTGTEKFLHNLCEAMDADAQFLLQAVHCLRINGNTRDIIGQALQLSKTEDLAFALLIYNNKLVNICRMREHTLHPMDLHLILNLIISSSSSFHTGESWSPICLPNFNPSGFLHAHISYLDDSCSTCLVLLSADRDSFFTLSGARSKVLAKLQRHGCLGSLAEAGERKAYTVESIGITPLRHFIYKSKTTAQFTWPEIGVPYLTQYQKDRIFGLYQHAHGRIHDTTTPLKLLYVAWKTETLLGWVTSGFELYAIFSPLISKAHAIQAVNKLLRWLKKQEDELFILRPPVYPR